MRLSIQFNLLVTFFVFVQLSILDTAYSQNKIYETININGKEWMTQNLNSFKFKNGDVIRQVRTAREWNDAYAKKEPVWMYFENNPKYANKYGRIYNYYAIIDPRGLAPDGYHIPSKNELETLASIPIQQIKSTSEWYLVKYKCKVLGEVTNYTNDGVAYKDSGYVDGDCQRGGSGNNQTGFNAFPGGRVGVSGNSEYFSKEVGYWSSTSAGELNSTPFGEAQWYLKIAWDENNPSLLSGSSIQGFYVRCIYGKSEEEIEMENRVIRKREDSIRMIKVKEQEVIQKRIDSINQIKKREQDSINAIKEMEQQRVYLLEQKRIDSISEVNRRIAERKERRLNQRKNIQLNYWGLGLSFNSLKKTPEVLNSNAWKFVTREGLPSVDDPVDGSGIGYSFFIGKRIASIIGVEFSWSEYFDGNFKINRGSTAYGNPDPKDYSLLRFSYLSIGPVITIPISKGNIDVKYLFTNSKSTYKEPTGGDFIKSTKSSSGSILSMGIRIPLGQGETLSNNLFSLGQVGFYYDMYKFNYNHAFGNLPAYNSGFTIKYINAIN